MSRNSIRLRAIIFALIGLGIQLAILLQMGFGHRWTDLLTNFLTSVTGLLIGAFILSRLFERTLVATETTWLKATLIGALIGWLALWIQTLSGSSVAFFSNLTHSGAFGDYIIKPTFWVMFLGSVPSILIGALFGYSTWKANHKSLP